MKAMEKKATPMPEELEREPRVARLHFHVSSVRRLAFFRVFR